MNLDTDTVNVTVSEAGGVVIEPDYVEYLRSHGYTIEGAKKAKVIPSSSRDMGHVVVQIDTYLLPEGHENMDLVADKITIPVCSCERFKYQESVNVAEMTLKEGDLGVCPHLKTAYKTIRAESDESQTRLD